MKTNISPEALDLDQYFLSLMANKQYIQASQVAPIINQTIINQLLTDSDTEDDGYMVLLPFAELSVRNKFVLDIYKKRGILDACKYFMHADRKTVESIAYEESDKNGLCNMQSAAPFISKDTLAEIVKKNFQNYIRDSINSLRPFIDQEVLQDMIYMWTEENQLQESYYYIRDARKDYEYLLKHNHSYTSEKNSPNVFIYHSRMDDTQLKTLFENHLIRFEHEKDELTCFKKVLRWSHEILLYEKQQKYKGDESATGIINFCQKNKTTVNCRDHAIVLTEALLALGYQARLLCCMPIDVLPEDNHTMTAVFSQTKGKWILLDSARNCYFTDTSGEMMSPAEVRTALITDTPFHICYMHRFEKIRKSSSMVQFDDDWYIDYLYKNMFRFYSPQQCGTTYQYEKIFYHLVPCGYSPHEEERIITNRYTEDERIIRTTDCETIFWCKPIGGISQHV